ncbi:MAG: hypothetical protein ACI4JU_06285 [Angelakisella sp.]
MKKFLAMALALLMVAVLLPVTAMAAEVTTVDELKDALKAGGSTIILSNDITVTDGIQIEVTSDTSINFNGNTLSGAVESGSILNSDGPTNLELSDPNNDGGYSIDGEIVAHEGGGYTQLAAITVWKPTVTIQSGKYTHDNAVILCQLQTNDSDAVGVVVNGGTFDGKGAASVVANVFGNVIINDGVFNAYDDGDASGECVYVSSGNSRVPSITTINNGTFNAVDRIFYVNVNTRYTQKITITGGTFTVAEGGSLIQVSSGDASDYLTITGGTFNVDPSAYVAEGYAVAYTNGKYVVAKLAGAGGTTQIEVSEIEENTGVTIPAEAAQGDAAIKVELKDSTVEFDAAAAAAMKQEDTSASDVVLEVKSEPAEDMTNIQLNETQAAAILDKSNAVVVELTLKVDGEPICTKDNGGFNSGKATVTIPYSGANASTKVYYVKENGQLEQMTVKGYTDSTVTFETSHFSHYVITTPTGAGSITIIVPGDTTDTTTTTETTKNPATGMNDFVGAAVALAVISVIGAAAVVRKK